MTWKMLVVRGQVDTETMSENEGQQRERKAKTEWDGQWNEAKYAEKGPQNGMEAQNMKEVQNVRKGQQSVKNGRQKRVFQNMKVGRGASQLAWNQGQGQPSKTQHKERGEGPDSQAPIKCGPLNAKVLLVKLLFSQLVCSHMT